MPEDPLLTTIRRLDQLERKFDKLATIERPAAVGARVYRDSAQTIADNTLTAITFSDVRFDTHGMFALASPTKLTILIAGVYVVSAHIAWAVNDVGRRTCYIEKNGTGIYIAGDQRNAVTQASRRTEISISTIYQFAKNDYIELIVLQESGGNLNVDYVAERSPELAIARYT